ncbi:MAG: tRNA (adenosine(37)-N6)-threonylcarbamoyltransferase complex ATPase subunit type 1 TsaE [Pseudomonadota bacterium]|nr:tRNA (adenosine(37)-N6)-threonylcarbamoyltransferase complex ATPase subunit type 1 TsaE [Pseudomonadota bacterium]
MTNSKTDYSKQVLFLADEAETTALAQRLAEAVNASKAYENGVMVYLNGDLGAGKSFFSRAFIQSYLPGQKVKSPTYTIVETYNCYNLSIHHLDLYRLCDPEELEYLAIRDLLSASYVALVEWPEKGHGILPVADIEINLSHREQGRQIELHANSVKGDSVLAKLSDF